VTSDAFAVTEPPEAVRLGHGAAATLASLTEGPRIIADLLEQSPATPSIIVWPGNHFSKTFDDAQLEADVDHHSFTVVNLSTWSLPALTGAPVFLFVHCWPAAYVRGPWWDS
jgi:hypothetical protein